jgi:hypothetical protein
MGTSIDLAMVENEVKAIGHDDNEPAGDTSIVDRGE